MPTKNEFHLPSFIFWTNVLQELNNYLDECKTFHFLSLSYFSKVFKVYIYLFIFQIQKAYFPKVKAPKYTRQEKCDKCIELKEKRNKALNETA
jgi:hypothetical protein